MKNFGPNLEKIRLAIVGLGYVGLPLALEFNKRRCVLGFDTDDSRVDELLNGVDRTLELSSEDLQSAENLTFTTRAEELGVCNCFIVTVPTPLTSHNEPDLSSLIMASRTVGRVLKKGDLVIFESTVYPGATEEVCVPILQDASGLEFNREFFVGYSPERINPGDKEHRVHNIKKVTSGSTEECAAVVDALYNEIVVVGTHKAPSIKVAEAAKIIENIQRDINIALINELAIVFDVMGLDSEAILKAAGTKWNFLPFRPGLVGGHCIGVDPYYLTYKAKSLGYEPEIILAGRKLNESMSSYISNRLIEHMAQEKIWSSGAKILIMGLAFKENCPDIRNTKIVDIINNLIAADCSVDVVDPWVSDQEAQRLYSINLLAEPTPGTYDAIVLTVAHSQFRSMGAEFVRSFGKQNHVLYDVKHVFSDEDSDLRL